jgi:hypothetical protein
MIPSSDRRTPTPFLQRVAEEALLCDFIQITIQQQTVVVPG